MSGKKHEEKEQAPQQEELKDETQQALEKLKVSYQKMEEKCNSALALAREYKADMQRMQERAKRVEEEKTKQVAETAVLAFLPVLDNLEIALTSCKEESIKKGFDLIKTQFEGVIAQMGAIRVDVSGEFDPEKHECISTMPAPKEEQKNKIAHVLKHGYELFGKVIRPAQVVVYGGNV